MKYTIMIKKSRSKEVYDIFDNLGITKDRFNMIITSVNVITTKAELSDDELLVLKLSIHPSNCTFHKSPDVHNPYK